jgi:hypothetical protein
MLITDFSAGELSPALFGRADIAQYYKGASFLENFLVIPAGGIRKRRGTTRCASLGGDCRLVPFMLDRGTVYIIELGASRFRLWKNGVTAVTPVLSGGASLYGSMEEVNAVQYAQNYDTMIFAHRDYPPLMLKRDGPDAFTLGPVAFDYSGKVVVSDPWGQYKGPKTVSREPFFDGPGTYPGSAAFFGGRLWFASSNNERQKVWASSAPDASGTRYGNFMTFTRYATVQRVLEDPDLHLFTATVTNNSDILTNIPEGLELLLEDYPLEEYYVYSAEQLFPIGTKPESIDGTTMKLSRPVSFPPNVGLTEEEKKMLDEDEKAFFEYFNKHTIGAIELYGYSHTSDEGVLETDWEYRLIVAGTLAVPEMTVTRDNRNPQAPAQTEVGTVNFFSPETKEIFASECADMLNRLVDKFDVPDGYDADAMSYFINNIKNAMAAEYNKFLTGVTASGGYGKLTFRGTLWEDDGPDGVIPKIRAFYDKADNVEISIQRWRDPSNPGEEDYDYPATEEDKINPDNAFFFEIASDMSDEIKWLANLRNLIIGTETAEWLVPAGVNATGIQAVINSRNGSADIQATSVGDGLVFFKAGRKAIAEYAYPAGNETFVTNDLAVLAPQMLQESPAADYDFISAPYNKVIVARADGAAALLLYDKSAGVMAWSRIRLGSGDIRSCATAKGSSGYDDIYFAVKNGGSYYLERLEEDSGPWRDGGGSYPVKARMTSMPVIAGEPFSKKRITSLAIRFLNSSLPVLTALPGGQRQVITGIAAPYTGIYKTPFPSGYDRDVFFDLTHDGDGPCVILAVNAEVQ